MVPEIEPENLAVRAALAIPPAARGAPHLMAQLARAKALGQGRPGAAMQHAEAMGADPRVVGALKAAVPAMGMSDADLNGLTDARHITTQFTPFLRQRSLFYALVEGGGMTRVGLRQRVGYTTLAASAFIAGEGAAVPLSRMEVPATGIPRSHANALIILTDDMIRNMGVAGEALISRELRRAIAPAVDAKFIDLIVDSATPALTSAGNTAANAAADLAALLSAVEPTAESRLTWALSPDVGILASTLVTPSGGFLFPDMSPTGGEMLNTEAIVCDALQAATIMLVDATGLAGDSELITIDASNQTSIEMLDAPTNNSVTPTPSTVVSMFQTDSTAVLATSWFGAYRFRDTAVATMSGVEWGAPVSG